MITRLSQFYYGYETNKKSLLKIPKYISQISRNSKIDIYKKSKSINYNSYSIMFIKKLLTDIPTNKLIKLNNDYRLYSYVENMYNKKTDHTIKYTY